MISIRTSRASPCDESDQSNGCAGQWIRVSSFRRWFLFLALLRQRLLYECQDHLEVFPHRVRILTLRTDSRQRADMLQGLPGA